MWRFHFINTNNTTAAQIGRQLAALGLASLCLLESGCVRRRLTVRTSPPGAQVYVDDQELGLTPCSASFVYYGTRKITVMKDGYRTETIFEKFAPPWYQIPPLDFITENLVARELRDERVLDVNLATEEIVPQQKLLERAQGLRDGARAGYVTPLVVSESPASDRPANLGLPGEGLPQGQPIPYQPLPAPSSGPPFRP